MIDLVRSAALGLSTWACVGLLAGCATTQMNSEWKDPGFIGTLPKASRLLVFCRARDDTLRRICEDQWAVRMGGEGISVVRSYSLAGLPPDGAANPAEVKAAAEASGAGAVVNMHLALSDFAVINAGPQMGVGVGGGSGYRGSGFGFGGIGLAFPIGGATTTQGMSSSTTLVDVASGALVWSGNADTAADADVSAQVSALTQVTIEALKKAGLI